ncbi:DUF4998 domain-containing protein [Pedobacter rhizosphaerae]|uniref:DUF5013 domain-containing protein n=1 Tax=Pedobacter rhizosphaerae TaxID=390241 RepID=A0A1H9R0T2_9SPHI|nr:DUF4998 domain-containing protein [Pedobacter rhizosphaerae]SER66451.1 protein of unknown function [Pedobacter rhizosphaerae]
MKYIIAYSMVAVALLMASCSKMDDYKKLTDGKEITYPGKADSLTVLSGRNRALVKFLLISDPNITKATIYWNNKANHQDVAITRGKGIDTIKVMVPSLPEGNYSFEVFTFDKNGNKSVAALKQGATYGDIFEKSLLNRILERAVYQPSTGATILNWRVSDAGSVGVDVTYTTVNGVSRTKRVTKAANQIVLTDRNPDTDIQYRTLFLPDSTAIDTFYSASVSRKINEFLLKNSGAPFIAGKRDGRWGDLAEWTTNAAAKNMSNKTIGGFDSYNGGGFISFEYWYSPQISNGKIFQTTTLPAGKYRFVATVSEINSTLEATYLVVDAGKTLPDVANISQAIGNFRFLDNSQNGKDYAVSFTLAQAQEISLGFVSTMFVKHESSIRISKVRLYKD